MAGERTMDEVNEATQREATFRAFVASHRQRALSLAWRLVNGDAAAAEDLVQDAFLQAWVALPKFRGEAALSTWFYRILVRRTQSHHRWAGVRRRWNAVIGAAAPDPASPATPDAGLQRRIGAALDGLSSGQREAFVLVHFEGFTVAEAAAVLGKAEGTIKSHVHRATTALREALGDLWEAS